MALPRPYGCERVGRRRDAGGEADPVAARRLDGGDAPSARCSGRPGHRRGARAGLVGGDRLHRAHRLSGRASASSGRRRAGLVHRVRRGSRRGCVDDRRAGALARSGDRRSRVGRGRGPSRSGASGVRPRGRGRAPAHSHRLAALLRLAARRRRARTADPLARLVRPARHGRDAGERAADTVRDVRDAGDRGRDRGSLAVVAARLGRSGRHAQARRA